MRTDASRLRKYSPYILGASVGLGLIFDILFYGKLPGISFPLYMYLVLAVLLLAAKKTGNAVPRQAVFAIAPLVFFAGMVYVRASGFLTFLNITASLYLLCLFVGMLFKPNLQKYLFPDYLKPLYQLPAEVCNKSVQVLSAFAGRHHAAAGYKVSPRVLRGIVITLPVVGLFVLLFASADLVFRRYLTEFFDFKIDTQWVPRTFLVVAVACGFMGVLAYVTQKSTDREHSAQATPGRKPLSWDLFETTILFASLNVLFLGFIVLQLAYLFGGRQNVVGQGFTYAEYARKGFFELMAVAVLTLVVITVAEKILLRGSERHAPRFKLLAGALIAQVLIIMASAFNRLSLYENAYGFTTLRLYSHIFLVWLAVIFGVLLYKIFWNRREHTFAFLSFMSVIALLAVINMVNIDAFAARKNIERYQTTGKLDTQYLTHLSDDAVGETVRLLDMPDFKSKDALAGSLYWRYQGLQRKSQHWQSANLSRDKALDELEAKSSLLEKNQNRIFGPDTFQEDR
ncbi:MAG TPA: DUF4173 domain-containing protein [Candidatus Limnocylindria bacterium]|nr:DUF4173 domain-containing protein [Candidatus Limnocylindria bacterium]